MSAVEHVAIPPAPALDALPLVTLYLTDRCNSRCVTCDYWRHGRTNLTLAGLEPMLPALGALHSQVVLLSGGEPLLNPEWQAIAARLRESGLRLWLLTSGLSLAKHAPAATRLFDAITVSLDGTVPATYAAIRGLDAFDKVCAGLRAAAAAGASVSVRVTLQRANFRELPRFVSLARELGARQVSFLAVDVGNAHAFARTGPIAAGLALEAADLPVLDELLDALEREHAADFASRFIAESPAKLRRIRSYFAALHGQGPFPAVRCNAPEFSAVIAADGRVQPCFFIAGPEPGAAAAGLGAQLNSPAMRALRATIRAGRRSECERCVCSMWREPGARGAADFLRAGRAH
jgi:MoaA/NifB/PqqE/SkfB family radical SAM enzyme